MVRAGRFVYDAEIVIVCLRRVRGSFKRNCARVRDWPCRKPRPFISVVNAVDFQVFISDALRVRPPFDFREYIDDCGARFKPDMVVKPVLENACNKRRFFFAG